MNYIEWKVDESFLNSPAITNRNEFAKYLNERTVNEMISSFTHFDPNDLEKMVKECERRILKNSLSGKGIEIGAGTALLSCLLAKRSDISSVHAVECVPDMVRLIQPQVKQFLLNQECQSKVISVIGDFNHLEISDEELDFLVEIQSWHHSDDLVLSLKEARRILKPGALILAFDRVLNDRTTDEEIEALLNQEYSEDFKRRNHYPLGEKLTRRDNGEREYREREWKAAFEKSGFKEFSFTPLNKTYHPWSHPGMAFSDPIGFLWEVKKWGIQKLKRPIFCPYYERGLTCIILRK